MNETAHTPAEANDIPTPWEWDAKNNAMFAANGSCIFWAPDGSYAGDGDIQVAAAIMLRAVNAHDDMLAALKKWVAVEDARDDMTFDEYVKASAEAEIEARAAISKATPPEGTRT